MTPGEEANDVENGKDKEYDGGRVIMKDEVDNRRAEAEDTMEYTRKPYELLQLTICSRKEVTFGNMAASPKYPKLKTKPMTRMKAKRISALLSRVNVFVLSYTPLPWKLYV